MSPSFCGHVFLRSSMETQNSIRTLSHYPYAHWGKLSLTARAPFAFRQAECQHHKLQWGLLWQRLWQQEGEINLSHLKQFHGPGAWFTKRSLFMRLGLTSEAEGKKLSENSKGFVNVTSRALCVPFRGRWISIVFKVIASVTTLKYCYLCVVSPHWAVFCPVQLLFDWQIFFSHCV